MLVGGGLSFNLANKALATDDEMAQPDILRSTDVVQGRIISAATIFDAPKRNAKRIKALGRDSVIPILAEIQGDRIAATSDLWYRTENGFVYSTGIQPVSTDLQAPVEPEIARERFWAEVCVPFTDTKQSLEPTARTFRRIYHGCVFRVVNATQDKQGQWWYRLEDGLNGTSSFIANLHVNAAHMRRLTPDDLAPLSPDIEDKRIQVNLKTNTITAYENGNLVKSVRCSSGILKRDTATPRGEMSVLYKMHTSHMRDRARTYDLSGVAFPTYFTWWGHAIHGTYWHNDWGTYRSHGCLNVPNEAARWFWRWTTPNAPYDKNFYSVTLAKTSGTKVTLI